MLFEEFDKKLREAADHHHPNYDEQAWVKMEKLLDKNLPVEKDRRRILFLVILSFLGLGGAGLFILKPWKSSDSIAIEKTTVSVAPERNTVVLPDQTIAIPDAPVPGNAIQPNQSFLAKPQVTRQDLKQQQKETEKISENQNEIPPPKTDNPVTETKSNQPILATKKVNSDDPFSLKKDKQEEPSQPLALADQPQKVKSKKQHAVFISVSGGPDISFISDKAGTAKLFGGAGIGYTYNNRISISTGFYTGRKIYTAGADAYNPPPGFYAYYPYLEKVDANCKVYEVPVQLSYHFGKSPNHNFFASAGVSSYFMKEEEYTYYYKYSQTGPTVSKKRSIYDLNKHYLAGLTLSAGYNKRISRHVSLSAEPYIKLPLKGVGYGNVKLNSAGVSMSVNVNPFAKKPK